MLSALCLLSCTHNEVDGPSRGKGGIHFAIQVGETSTRSGSTASSDAFSGETTTKAISTRTLALRGDDPKDSLTLTAVESPWTGGVIKAGLSTEEKTKAAPVTTETMHNSMGVFHYVFTEAEYYDFIGYDPETDDYGDSWFDKLENEQITSITLPTAFANVKLTRAADWRMSDEYLWSEDSPMQTFIAYAPYEDEIATLTYTGAGKTGAPAFDYEVPEDVNSQVDFLVGNATTEIGYDWTYGGVEYADPMRMVLYHQLVAIRFITKDIGSGSISRITLKNIYSKGHWDDIGWLVGEEVEKTPATRDNTIILHYLWKNLSDKKDYSVSFDPALTISGDRGQVLNPDELTFLLLPQVLPDDAAIEIEYTSAAGESKTLRAVIGGNDNEWTIGRQYEYFISHSGIGSHLEVIPPVQFSHKGASHPFTVKSYTQAQDGTKAAAPWTLEYVRDNAGTLETINPSDPDYPSWLSFTSSASSSSSSAILGSAGNTTPESFTATVSAQTPTQGNVQNAHLKAAASVGSSASPYDLSTAGGTRAASTANCYIINAPGYYTFPLVYGNAIKDGQTNAQSYTSRAGNTQLAPILNPFVNHLDRPITDPYIYNNVDENGGPLVPSNATLVWQDEDGLVTDIALSSDGHSISFVVPSSTITQGNALIAVRDAQNTIMWSWHIWVTDYVPLLDPDVHDPMRDKLVQNYTDHHYAMMPINLGWCDNGEQTWHGRSVLARITQTGALGKSEVFEIAQKPFDGTDGWSCTLYQWGRKDPMLPVVGSRSDYGYDSQNVSDKHSYPINNPLAFGPGSGQVSIGTAIQHPNIMYAWGPLSVSQSSIRTRAKIGTRDFFGPESDWCQGHYSNLWSADAVNVSTLSDELVVKTIYDPCPSGYRLPYERVFSGRKLNNYDGGYKDAHDFGGTANSPYSSDQEVSENGGHEFYCHLMHEEGVYDPTGGTYFLPMVPTRCFGNESSAPSLQYQEAWYTTAGTRAGHEDGSAGLVIRLYDWDCYEHNDYACLVRPVREDIR